MPIEMIVFDLGKVIFDFDFEKVIKEYCKKTDKLPDFYSAANLDLLTRYELGIIDSAQFFKSFSKETEYKGSFNEFSTLWNNIFKPIDDTIEIIGKLASKYRLSLLSNTNEMHFNYLLDGYPRVFTLFEKMFLSYQMGLRKPDPKIYQGVLDFFNIEPAKVFFIDDIAQNVEAANMLSIKAYQFTSAANLKKSLKNEGVLL